MLAGPSDVHVKEKHTARESKRELIRLGFSATLAKNYETNVT
jgi:hypothetical protein